MSKQVQVDLSGLSRFQSAIERELFGTGPGKIRNAIKQWAHRYRSYIRDRFDRYSKGGGNWPYLAKSTLAARRRKSKGGKLRRGQTWKKKARRMKKGSVVALTERPKILRDTGILFAAQTPEFVRKPGQYEQHMAFGVRVGYGGPTKHRGSKRTIAEIANFHQEGGGRLPRRTIIVSPSASVMNKMAQDMAKACQGVLDGR